MAYHVPKSPDLPILAFLMIFHVPRLDAISLNAKAEKCPDEIRIDVQAVIDFTHEHLEHSLLFSHFYMV